MMNEENIRAILETNFAGYKDEIIDVAVKKIIGLLDKHDEEVIKDTVESIWGEPCEDCISRQAVKEAIMDCETFYEDRMDTFIEDTTVLEVKIDNLPSVTPQTDILDKIKAEIEQAYCKVVNDYDQGINYGLYMAIRIIDKYDAESEEGGNDNS